MMAIRRERQKPELHYAKKEKVRKAEQAITLPPLKPLNLPDLIDTPLDWEYSRLSAEKRELR